MKSVHHPRLCLTLVTALILTGCLDDGGRSSSDDTRTGALNINGFSGVSYRTASRTGETDAQGQFQYYPGETVSFRVGDLTLAQGVPAKEFVTPLEFFEDTRQKLDNPGTDDEGLRTHTLTEQALLSDNALINLTRLLLAMNWEENLKESDGIEFRERVISQLNAALPDLTAPIDFSVSEAEFAHTGSESEPAPSPANQLLAAICFYPEDDELCDAPPTQAEIDALPPRPENEDDRDPDVEYREDLENKRDNILEARRSLDDFDREAAEDYLTRELNAITTTYGNRFYLNNETASYAPSDTGIKSVNVRRVGSDAGLAQIEAISTRQQDVVVHSFDWQSATVDYFVAGASGGESEIVISFRPDNTYRWVRKSLRVLIR